MFQRFLTPCSSALAVALSLMTAPAWAQPQDTSAMDEPIQQERSLLPPNDVPQPALMDQMDQQQLDQSEDQSDENQQIDSQHSAERYEAPPEPRDDAATDVRGNVREDDRSMAPAELGVYMLPHDGPGVRVGSVTAGTAADEAGLRPGDLILSIKSQSVATPQEVSQLIRESQPGETVELIIWRDGTEQPVTATLGEYQPVTPWDEQAYGDGPVYDGPTEVIGRPYTTYYRAPVERPFFRYGPRPYYGNSYYYGNPYSYRYNYYGRYYGTPRFGYYESPWRSGVRVGPFGFNW